MFCIHFVPHSFSGGLRPCAETTSAPSPQAPAADPTNQDSPRPYLKKAVPQTRINLSPDVPSVDMSQTCSEKTFLYSLSNIKDSKIQYIESKIQYTYIKIQYTYSKIQYTYIILILTWCTGKP